MDLKEFAGGALQEKVSKSFDRVHANLLDPNTAYKEKREINIKMVFQQNEARDDVAIDIQVKEKLAPQIPISTRMAIGTDLRTGELIAEEYGVGQIRGQMEMEEEVIDIRKEATIKTGIASKGDAIVPSPVKLRPYRTFLEVEQPESEFIFRMRNSGAGVQCALFEADGGAWRNQARKNIYNYLVDRIKGEDVLIIA